MSEIKMDRTRTLADCFSSVEWDLLQADEQFRQAVAMASDTVEEIERLCVMGRKLLVQIRAPATLNRRVTR